MAVKKTKYLTRFILFALIVGHCGATVTLGAESITNKIQKALRGIIYTEQGKTVEQAKKDHDGNALTCIQYAYRIKDIVPTAEIWQVGGKHAIVIIRDEKGKRVCYSNGKITKEWVYLKVRRVQ